MDHLHQEEPDFLDLDKPGYYFPKIEELFLGAYYEFRDSRNSSWILMTWVGSTYEMDYYRMGYEFFRVRYLQAKDILDLGFGRVQAGLHMYIRGSYTIIAYRLFDPTYSKIRIMQSSTPVYEGICRSKSELKRILKINEIDFADN